MIGLHLLIKLLIIHLFEATEHCREKERLVDNFKEDLFLVVDSEITDTLILNCHYCGEHDDGQAKIWYKTKHFGIVQRQSEEVKLNMHNDPVNDRIKVVAAHTLVISNFSEVDNGLYYCLKHNEDFNDTSHKYLVNAISSENITNVIANSSAWLNYHNQYFTPVNQLLNDRINSNVLHLGAIHFSEVQVLTKWETWSQCQNNEENKCMRQQLGLCRIKFKPAINLESTDQKGDEMSMDEEFILVANILPCRSKTLDRIWPSIANLTNFIPNFVQVEFCTNECHNDKEKLQHYGWKTGKKTDFKYREKYVLAEGDHLVLICPESSLLNPAVWRRNGKILKAEEGIMTNVEYGEPHVYVDSFQTLYLNHIKKTEAGNYSCYINSTKMQQVSVYVVSESQLLTEYFLRHLIYLGLILSLTCSCYTAGLFIACKNRSKFKVITIKSESSEESTNLI